MTTEVPYCWPGCNPAPGEPSCSCICRALAIAEGVPFERIRRRRLLVVDFKDKPYSVCHSGASVHDLVKHLKEREEMTPNEYQKLAARTICPQGLEQLIRLGASRSCIARKIIDLQNNTRILHASIGISGEAGEIASQIQKWLYYGKELDTVNLLEEIGDSLWYIAEMCEALGTTMEEVMKRNIEKLQKRYPEKYTDHHAAEENRDRAGEREILEEGSCVPKDQYIKYDTLKRDVVSEIPLPLNPPGFTFNVQNGHGFAEPSEQSEE